MVTVAPLVKLDPYMVTEVPPDVGPESGEMLVTAGGEGGWTLADVIVAVFSTAPSVTARTSNSIGMVLSNTLPFSEPVSIDFCMFPTPF